MHGPSREVGRERFALCQNLAMGYLDRRRIRQTLVTFQIVWCKGLFKPMNLIICEHLRTLKRVFKAKFPKRVASSRIDHQCCFVSSRLPCQTNQSLVVLQRLMSKRSPSEINTQATAR